MGDFSRTDHSKESHTCTHTHAHAHTHRHQQHTTSRHTTPLTHTLTLTHTHTHTHTPSTGKLIQHACTQALALPHSSIKQSILWLVFFLCSTDCCRSLQGSKHCCFVWQTHQLLITCLADIHQVFHCISLIPTHGLKLRGTPCNRVQCMHLPVDEAVEVADLEGWTGFKELATSPKPNQCHLTSDSKDIGGCATQVQTLLL